MVPGLVIDGSIPTFRQLVPVEGSPLKHHSGGAPGELTVEKAAIESDSGAVLAIAGVEARRIVITEEHQDGDPIERADAWHGFRTYRPGPTGLTRVGRQQLLVSHNRFRKELTQPGSFNDLGGTEGGLDTLRDARRARRGRPGRPRRRLLSLASEMG
jgi:hypothetical protein